MSLYYFRIHKEEVSKKQLGSVLRVVVEFELDAVSSDAGKPASPAAMASPPREAEPRDGGSPILRVKLRFSASAVDELASVLSMGKNDETIRGSEEDASSGGDGDYAEPFQSICVVCKKLARACGGDFEVFTDHVLLSLPVLVQADPVKEEANLKAAVDGEDGGSAGYIYSNKALMGMDMSVLMRDHVCAYVTDRQLEGLFVEVLAKIPGGLQMTMHRELNPVDLKVRAVVIVQSLQALEEVRGSQYVGKVVLFTERMSYLDKQERSRFDYVLPLPPGDEDMMGFLRFLRQCKYQIPQQETQFGSASSVLFRNDHIMSEIGSSSSVVSHAHHQGESIWVRWACLIPSNWV
jgi:hypothetical protein